MVNHPRPSILLWAIVPILASLTASDADACWWRHHCRCHHGSGTSAAPSSAPAAAPKAAAAPQVVAAPAFVSYAPVAYAPVGYAPMQAASAPASGLTDVIEFMKILPQIRDAFGNKGSGNSGSGSNGSTASSSDMTQVRASLAELKAGQADLRGRLINNAGISQAIGEQLVKTDARVATMQGAVGANGILVKQLALINKTLTDRLPSAGAEATPFATGAETEPTWLKEFKESLEKRLDKIEKRLPPE